MKLELIHELDVTPEDHSAFSAHIGAAFAENSETPGDRSFFFQPPHMRVVCRSDDAIAGHLAIFLRTVRVGEVNVDTACIGDVSVAKAHRRQGIAGAMVEKALQVAQEVGLDFVWLAGDEHIYFEAGFFAIENEVKRVSWETGETVSGTDHHMLVHDLGGWDWDHSAAVNMLGPML